MNRIHSHQLERWLGIERIEYIQRVMRGWYYKPICLLDVPGSVYVTADGDFVGNFRGGHFMSALDVLHEMWRRVGQRQYGFAGAGFASISDLLLRASTGYSQYQNFQKVGTTGVVASTNSLWGVGNTPVAGAAGAATPGGTAHAGSDTGALKFNNPASGTLHLTGADAAGSVINNALLLYDRLFSVAKTASSLTQETVTGVPTRYQSTTATNPDFIGGNFGFIEAHTVLGAVTHNWTVCTYKDQADAASTLPSVTGNSGNIVNRLDQPTSQWFVPLESGDVGIKAWTALQCSVNTVTGTANFCIGHPIGFMLFPLASTMFPFDWITNRDLAPRIFDDACLALLEVVKPATTATTYTGRIVATNAAA